MQKYLFIRYEINKVEFNRMNNKVLYMGSKKWTAQQQDEESYFNSNCKNPKVFIYCKQQSDTVVKKKKQNKKH